jgi:hypothetical protein
MEYFKSGIKGEIRKVSSFRTGKVLLLMEPEIEDSCERFSIFIFHS